MIKIKVYKNGYEITSHAEERVCSEVSLWHWISSNLILGLDKEAREYTSHRENPDNPNEGLSWVIYSPQKGNLEWILEDLVISAERWAKEFWGEQVAIEHLNESLSR